MAFDAAHYPIAAAPTFAALIDVAGEPCPLWTTANPDRALALLFVAPRGCMAVDVLADL